MKTITHINEQKRVLLELLIPLCPFIALDATVANVEVPRALRSPELVLRIGRDPRVIGMPDLRLDEKGWSATIAISGVQHLVFLPWEACNRYWVGEPFAGPIIVWLTREELAERDKRSAKSKAAPKLRLVQEEP